MCKFFLVIIPRVCGRFVCVELYIPFKYANVFPIPSHRASPVCWVLTRFYVGLVKSVTVIMNNRRFIVSFVIATVLLESQLVGFEA